MLVYCSNLYLRPADGIQSILSGVARWLGRKSKGYIDPQSLLTGANQRLADGSRIESTSTVRDPTTISYPLLASIRLSHSDDRVSGRQWIAEIGLEQSAADASIHCSVLLQTNDVSTQVMEPVQATRPIIVETLAQSCSPASNTPGLSQRALDESNARAFLSALEHRTRVVPWVVVSPMRDGGYLIEPRRLLSLLVGIADVFVIPSAANTFDIEQGIGSRYAAWLGAINIIYPPRPNSQRDYCETTRFLPDRIQGIIDDEGRPEFEILAAVTHRTNLPNSWKHVSSTVVSNARLRQQLTISIQKAQDSEETKEYALLLQAADQEIKEKESELRGLQENIEDRDEAIARLEAENEGLKYSLNEKRTSDNESASNDTNIPLREAVLASVSGDPTLYQSLTLVSNLFSERVVVLDSAFEAARKTHDFKYGKQALYLLLKLATDYWSALATGQGDTQAKKVFGKSYSPRESENLSKSGLRNRTFDYDGRSLEMLKHLKIGVKDSQSETLQIHFEWLSDDQKRIIIGHCGPHIDF